MGCIDCLQAMLLLSYVNAGLVQAPFLGMRPRIRHLSLQLELALSRVVSEGSNGDLTTQLCLRGLFT